MNGNKKNNKDKTRSVFVIIICVLALIATAVIVLILRNGCGIKDKTVIKVNGETSKTLKAELSGFYPGNTQECTIMLSGTYAENYYITLNFRDDKESNLENYLTVVIKTAERTVAKSLKDLLSGEELILGKNASEINIIYSMPENIGNEAQGTGAVFYIDLTAKITNDHE